ncbi:MAG: LamG domain-containing protein, partial [Bacteroidota bacterium]
NNGLLDCVSAGGTVDDITTGIDVNDVDAGTISVATNPVCADSTASIVSDVDATGDATPVYSFEQRVAGGSWVAASGTATGATFETVGLVNTTNDTLFYEFRRIATSTLNSIDCRDTSNVVTVVVEATPDLTVTINTPTGLPDQDVNNKDADPTLSGEVFCSPFTFSATNTSNTLFNGDGMAGSGNDALWIKLDVSLGTDVTAGLGYLNGETYYLPFSAFGTFGDQLTNGSASAQDVEFVLTPYFESDPAATPTIPGSTGTAELGTDECAGPAITISFTIEPKPDLAVSALMLGGVAGSPAAVAGSEMSGSTADASYTVCQEEAITFSVDEVFSPNTAGTERYTANLTVPTGVTVTFDGTDYTADATVDDLMFAAGSDAIAMSISSASTVTTAQPVVVALTPYIEAGTTDCTGDDPDVVLEFVVEPQPELSLSGIALFGNPLVPPTLEGTEGGTIASAVDASYTLCQDETLTFVVDQDFTANAAGTERYTIDLEIPSGVTVVLGGNNYTADQTLANQTFGVNALTFGFTSAAAITTSQTVTISLTPYVENDGDNTMGGAGSEDCLGDEPDVKINVVLEPASEVDATAFGTGYTWTSGTRTVTLDEAICGSSTGPSGPLATEVTTDGTEFSATLINSDANDATTFNGSCGPIVRTGSYSRLEFTVPTSGNYTVTARIDDGGNPRGHMFQIFPGGAGATATCANVIADVSLPSDADENTTAASAINSNVDLVAGQNYVIEFWRENQPSQGNFLANSTMDATVAFDLNAPSSGGGSTNSDAPTLFPPVTLTSANTPVGGAGNVEFQLVSVAINDMADGSGNDLSANVTRQQADGTPGGYPAGMERDDVTPTVGHEIASGGMFQERLLNDAKVVAYVIYTFRPQVDEGSTDLNGNSFRDECLGTNFTVVIPVEPEPDVELDGSFMDYTVGSRTFTLDEATCGGNGAAGYVAPTALSLMADAGTVVSSGHQVEFEITAIDTFTDAAFTTPYTGTDLLRASNATGTAATYAVGTEIVAGGNFQEFYRNNGNQLLYVRYTLQPQIEDTGTGADAGEKCVGDVFYIVVSVEPFPDLDVDDVSVNSVVDATTPDVTTGTQSYTVCSGDEISFDVIKQYTSGAAGAERYRIEYEFGADVSLDPAQTTDVNLDDQSYPGTVTFTPTSTASTATNVVVKLTPYIEKDGDNDLDGDDCSGVDPEITLTFVITPEPVAAVNNGATSAGTMAEVCSDLSMPGNVASYVLASPTDGNVLFRVVSMGGSGLTGFSAATQYLGEGAQLEADGTITNTTNAPIDITYTITPYTVGPDGEDDTDPSAGGTTPSDDCVGDDLVFTLTIKPEPVLTQNQSVTVCSDEESGLTLTTTQTFAGGTGGGSNNALNFTNSSDIVSATGTNLPQVNATRTIEAWINADPANNNFRTFVEYGNHAVSNQRMALCLNNAGRFYVAGQNNDITSTSADLRDNSWHHVAFIHDGATNVRKLYVDGVDVTPGGASTNAYNTQTQAVFIGESGQTDERFVGSVDEVAIWNTVRTPAEIAASFSSGIPLGTTGLLLYYDFAQGTAGAANPGVTNLPDLVGSANGTLTGFALSGTTSNWVTGAPVTGGVAGTVFTVNSITFDGNATAPTGFTDTDGNTPTSGGADLLEDEAWTNTTNDDVTVTYSITPSFGGCPGDPVNVTIIVEPIPTITVAVTPEGAASATDVTDDANDLDADETAAEGAFTICSGDGLQIQLSSSTVPTTPAELMYNVMITNADNDVTTTTVSIADGTMADALLSSTAADFIDEALTNTTAAAQLVVFKFTPFIDGDATSGFSTNDCIGEAVEIEVTVEPKPVMAVDAVTINSVTTTGSTSGTMPAITEFTLCNAEEITIDLSESITPSTAAAGTERYRVTYTLSGGVTIPGVTSGDNVDNQTFLATTAPEITFTPTNPGMTSGTVTVELTPYLEKDGNTEMGGAGSADCIGDNPQIRLVFTVEPKPDLMLSGVNVNDARSGTTISGGTLEGDEGATSADFDAQWLVCDGDDVSFSVDAGSTSNTAADRYRAVITIPVGVTVSANSGDIAGLIGPLVGTGNPITVDNLSMSDAYDLDFDNTVNAALKVTIALTPYVERSGDMTLDPSSLDCVGDMPDVNLEIEVEPTPDVNLTFNSSTNRQYEETVCDDETFDVTLGSDQTPSAGNTVEFEITDVSITPATGLTAPTLEDVFGTGVDPAGDDIEITDGSDLSYALSNPTAKPLTVTFTLRPQISNTTGTPD